MAPGPYGVRADDPMPVEDLIRALEFCVRFGQPPGPSLIADAAVALEAEREARRKDRETVDAGLRRIEYEAEDSVGGDRETIWQIARDLLERP